MNNDLAKIGRLAMRIEGDNWVAYYMLPDADSAPLVLGSIQMAIVTSNDERKQAFMAIMRDFVSDLVEEKTGVRPTWGEPELAPEHERAGQG